MTDFEPSHTDMVRCTPGDYKPMTDFEPSHTDMVKCVLAARRVVDAYEVACIVRNEVEGSTLILNNAIADLVYRLAKVAL